MWNSHITLIEATYTFGNKVGGSSSFIVWNRTKTIHNDCIDITELKRFKVIVTIMIGGNLEFDTIGLNNLSSEETLEQSKQQSVTLIRSYDGPDYQNLCFGHTILAQVCSTTRNWTYSIKASSENKYPWVGLNVSRRTVIPIQYKTPQFSRKYWVKAV